MLNSVAVTTLGDLERRLPLAIERLHDRRHRLMDYQSIQRQVRTVNVVENISFRQEFTRFYRLRGTAEFRTNFFAAFEELKRLNNVTFDQVLSLLHERCSQVHASFSSKIVASLDPRLPVYDSEVLKRLGLSVYHAPDAAVRLRRASERYRAIIEFFEAVLERPEVVAMFHCFDARFPEFGDFTPTKKLDLIMWQARD